MKARYIERMHDAVHCALTARHDFCGASSMAGGYAISAGFARQPPLIPGRDFFCAAVIGFLGLSEEIKHAPRR